MFLRKFLYVTSAERKAALVLALFIVVVGAFCVFLHDGVEVTGGDYASVAPNDDDHGSRQEAQHRRRYYHVTNSSHSASMFRFDPNTATVSDFSRLGFPQWQINNIMKYRSKGGRFHKPSDFSRIYGITKERYAALEPYIVIAEEGGDRLASAHESDTVVRHVPHYGVDKLAEGEMISLNKADTAQLKRVPGIGSYYARKIVEYRDRLGGFADVHQVMEVVGVPSSAMKHLKVSNYEVSKIAINTADVRQLSRHPYISYSQAKQIEGYRRMRGRFRSVDDMRVLSSFSVEDLKRLEPYIMF